MAVWVHVPHRKSHTKSPYTDTHTHFTFHSSSILTSLSMLLYTISTSSLPSLIYTHRPACATSINSYRVPRVPVSTRISTSSVSDAAYSLSSDRTVTDIIPTNHDLLPFTIHYPYYSTFETLPSPSITIPPPFPLTTLPSYLCLRGPIG